MQDPVLREREIFLAALDFDCLDERHRYLDRACGNADPELRQRLEHLLFLHLQHPNFLVQPPEVIDLRPMVDQFVIAPGHYIGTYQIVRLLGDGGFGAVYLAEQFLPLRRQVAIKVMKGAGGGSPIVARFEAERQVLASLNHPFIAKIFDASVSESGHPYFVMEYVDGQIITSHFQMSQSSLTDLIGLFIDVCRAVQHAHQKGIIHRDLKPSNVLVVTDQGQATPRVIDFGIAVVMRDRRNDRSVAADPTEILGSPAYMSPEQLMGAHIDIDTRSDLYSLGVLLYELLTGTTPAALCDNAALQNRDWKAVSEFVPPRPSEVSSRQVSDRPHNDSTNNRPSITVPVDLDCIVMKVLAIDRNDRYDTVQQFVEDLERLLRVYPVSAHPTSHWYHAKKFIARHQIAVSLGVLLLAATVGAIGLLMLNLSQVRAARNEQRQLVQQLKRKNGIVARSLKQVEQARAVADTRLYEALMVQINRALADGQPQTVRELLEQCPPEQRSWEWRRLQQIFATESTQVPALADRTIRWIEFTDGEFFLALDSQGRLGVIDRSTQQIVQEKRFALQPSLYASCRLSHDSTKLAVVELLSDTATAQVAVLSLDRDVMLDELARFSIDRGKMVSAMALDWDRRQVILATTTDHLSEGNIEVWDVSPPLQVHVEQLHEAMITDISVSSSGNRLATTSLDGTVKLWSLDDLPTSGESLQREKATVVDEIQFHPSGTKVASGSAGGYAIEWDVATGLSRIFRGHTGSVTKLRYVDDGRWLCSAGDDGMINIWDGNDGTLRQSLQGPARPVRAFAVSSDGSEILAGGESGGVARVLPSGKNELRSSAPIPRAGKCIALQYFTQCNRLARLDAAGQLTLHDLSGPATNGVDVAPGDVTVSAMASLPELRTLIFGTNEGVVFRRQIDNSDLPTKLIDMGRPITAVDISRDGRWLLGATSDNMVTLLHVPTAEQTSIECPLPIQNICFSGPQDRQFVVLQTETAPHLSGGGQAMFVLFETESGKRLKELPLAHVNGVMQRCGESRFAIGTTTGSLVGIDMTADQGPTFDSIGHPLRDLTSCCNHTRLIGVDVIGKVHVWSTASGRLLATFESAFGPVQCVAMGASDDLWLGMADGTLNRWLAQAAPR